MDDALFHQYGIEPMPIHDLPFGPKVQDISGRSVKGSIEHMMDVVHDHAAASLPTDLTPDQRQARLDQAAQAALDDLIQMINLSLQDKKLHVDAHRLLDTHTYYSYEFSLIVSTYAQAICGDLNFNFNRGTTRTAARDMAWLLRPFSMPQVYQIMPRFTSKFANTEIRVIETSRSYAVLQWWPTREAELLPASYRRPYLAMASEVYQGLFAVLPQALEGQPLAQVEEHKSMLQGDACFEWTFTWQPADTDRSRRFWLSLAGSALLLLYFLLRLPLYEWVALLVPVPALAGFYNDRLRLARSQEVRHRAQLLEQQQKGEEKQDQLLDAYRALNLAKLGLERKVDELTALHEITLTISSTLDPDNLLDEILRLVCHDLHFDRALILLVDEERRVLTGARSSGGTPEMAAVVEDLEIPLDPNGWAPARAALTGAPVLVHAEDAAPNAAYLFETLKATSALSVPLMAKGRAAGVLVVDNSLSRRPIPPEDQDTLMALGRTIAVALENVTLYRTMEHKVAERTRRLDATVEEFRAMLDIIDYGVLLLDKNLHVRIANRALKEMWGLPDELVARRPHAKDLIEYNRYTGVYDVPDDQWDTYVMVREAMVSEGDISPTEMRRADGRILQYQSKLLPGGSHLITYLDMTDLVRETEAAEINEQRYAQALQVSDQSLWEWNLDTGEMRFGTLFWQQIGGTPPASPMTIDNFIALVHPEDRHLVERDLMPFATGEADTIHGTIDVFRILTGTGRHRYFTLRSSVSVSELDKTARLTGLIRDITEQVGAEHALRESQRRLADIIDFLPDATFVINRQGRVIAWNRAIEAMTGVPAVDMLGKRNYEHAIPFYGERRPILIDLVLEDTGKVEAQYDTIERQGDILTGETHVPNLRGKEAYLMGTAGILYDSQGNIAGAIETIRDITQRKRAEEAFRQSQSNFYAVVESMDEGYCEVSFEGRITYANLALCRILGYSKAEAIGRSFRHFAVRSELRRLWTYFETLRETGEAPGKLTLQIRTKAGSLRVGESIFSVIYESDAPVGARGIIRDITERKRAETALRLQNEYLDALHATALSLMSRLDLNDLLETLITRAGQLLGAEHGSIYLVDPNNAARAEAIERSVAFGILGQTPNALIARGEGLAGRVWETGHPIAITNYDTWEHRAPSFEYGLIGAAVAVPLRSGSTVIGTLSMAHDASSRRRFGDEEIDLLERFAQLAAIAIENARLFEAEAIARHQAETLQAATQALSATMDLQEVFERILTELQKVVPYDSASVQRLGENGDCLEVIGGIGFENLDDIVGTVFDLTSEDDFPNREVIQTQNALIVENAVAEYGAFSRKTYTNVVLSSWLGVPLHFGDRVIGMITLDKYDPGFYTPQHAHLATAFAAQAAIAIENARLYTTAEEARQTAETLRAANIALTQSLDLDSICERLLDYLQLLVHYNSATIFLLEGRRLTARAAHGYERWTDIANALDVSFELEPDSTMDRIVTRQTSLTVPDTSQEPSWKDIPSARHIKSWLGVPMSVGERVIGVCSLDSTQLDFFTEEYVRLAEALAAQAAFAVENARLFEATNRLLEETRQRAAELATINSISQALVYKLEIDALIELVGEKLRETFGAPSVYIAIYHHREDTIHIPYYMERGERLDILEPFPPGALSRTLINKRRPLLCNTLEDIVAQGAEVNAGEPTTAYLGVPILAGDRILGIISVQSFEEHAYGETDVRLLSTIAANVGVAMQNAQLFEETRHLLEETRQRAAELATINSVSQALSTQLETDALIELVGEKLRQTFSAQVVYVALYNDDTHTIRTPYYIDHGQRIHLNPVELGPGLASRIIRSRASIILRDAQEAIEYGAVIVQDDEATQSFLGVPILIGGEAAGVISVQSIHKNAYDEADARLLGTIAANVGAVIQRARLFEETRQRAADMEAINSVSQALVSQLELDALIELAGDKLRETFDAQIAYVALYNVKTHKIELPYYFQEGKRITGHTLEYGRGLTSKILQTGEALLINHNMEESTDKLGVKRIGTPAKSYLGMPITVSDEVIGVVSVQNTQTEGRFSTSDMRLLGTIAANVGVAIQNAQLFEATNRLLEETRQRAAELATINSISQAISTQLDLQVLVELVGESLRQTFEVQAIYVALYDKQTETIRFPYYVDRDQWLERPPVPLGHGLTSHIIQTREPLVLNTFAEMEALDAIVVDEPSRSYLGMPIMAGDEVAGVISIQSFQEDAYTQDDLHLLSTIAANVGVAIRNAQLFQEAKRRADEMATIAEVGREISATLDLPKVLEYIAARAQDLLNADTVVLSLLRPETDSLEVVVALGRDAEHFFTAPPQTLGKGIGGSVAESGAAEVVNFPGQDPRALPVPGARSEGDADADAMMVVPLQKGERTIGIMVLWRRRNTGGIFTEDDLSFLMGLARQAAIAIENAQLFEEIEQAREAAEVASQAKSTFLANVSHELRTPLTSVLGFTKIIKKRLDDMIFPVVPRENRKVRRAIQQVSTNVGIIVSEGERLTALINDVLDLAKIEAGKVEWHMQTVDIQSVIERSVAATASLFNAKPVELIVDLSDDLPPLVGDQDRLIQVMVNLISNAAKFTDEGSVVCRARQIGNDIVVSVIDTGVGIMLEDQNKVFEQFVQVGDTLTDKPKGTGLGLPISKQIVEYHGGRIWVNSKPGEGATFSFTVPLRSSNLQHQAKRVNIVDFDAMLAQLKRHIAAAATRSGATPEVLVVDDDPSLRELLRQEMEAENYKVREAVDGRDALEAIERKRPDLVILDVMMPELSGFEVVKLLKASPATVGLPVIIVSVSEDREQGYRLGVDRYFTKPIDTDRLLAEVEHLVVQGTAHKQVLVVDQDIEAVEALTEALETQGYDVTRAYSSREAMEIARASRPDIIMVNLMLSEKDRLVHTLRGEEGMEETYFFLFA